MVLSGRQIKEKNIFKPFFERYKENGISGGIGNASYDIALDQDIFLGIQGFSLASSREHFSMPLDVCGIVHDKSTWARVGISVQNTFIDPGWNGYLTLEINNNSNTPIEIKAGTPIAQIVFHQMAEATEEYTGKYQNQERGVVAAKL